VPTLGRESLVTAINRFQMQGGSGAVAAVVPPDRLKLRESAGQMRCSGQAGAGRLPHTQDASTRP